MVSSDRSRIPVHPNYRYPARWTKGIIIALLARSAQKGVVGLQFEDEIVDIGRGEYVCTIAPPTLGRFIGLLIKPDYRLASYYTTGYWCCEKRKLYSFLEMLRTQRQSPLRRWARLFSKHPIRDRIFYRLFPLRVRKNIALHYNTSPEFMKLILGDGLEYTCAFFDDDHASLTSAQENKVNLVVSRLAISSDHRVLDVGCGWGQIAEAIARKTGAEVTGINLSTGQIEYAKANQSSERLSFFLSDYEAFVGEKKFDRIYSIGMLEHVGKGHLSDYFCKIRSLLVPGGLALVHSIVRERPESTNSWLDAEIFPGAHIPQLSEIVAHIERTRLRILQIFIHDRINYYFTLMAWADNFYKNEIELRRILASRVPMDDIPTIMNIWEFYLCASRLSFEEQSGDSFIVQLVLRA